MLPNILLFTKIQAAKCGFDSGNTVNNYQQTNQRIFLKRMNFKKNTFLLLQKVSKSNLIPLPFTIYLLNTVSTFLSI